MTRKKGGRRANDDDRVTAKIWADLYRRALGSPDGSVCVNPESPHEERTYIDADDISPLLKLLDHFAENGTFKEVDTWLDDLLIRSEFRQLCTTSGLTRAKALELLSEKYHCSTRKIEYRIDKKFNEKS